MTTLRNRVDTTWWIDELEISVGIRAETCTDPKTGEVTQERFYLSLPSLKETHISLATLRALIRVLGKMGGDTVALV